MGTATDGELVFDYSKSDRILTKDVTSEISQIVIAFI
jgi:hypothetical protein